MKPQDIRFADVITPGPVWCQDVVGFMTGKRLGTLCQYPVHKDLWCIDLTESGIDLHENARCYQGQAKAQEAIQKLLKG